MNDQTKKDFVKILEEVLDRKFEEKFIPLLNQGFEQVIMPRLEEMDERLDGMEKGFKQINSKLDNINRRLDSDSTKIGDHDRRIKKLENARATN